ncbi:DUF3592 domain-containing protein [Kineococcus sp. SYSU DK002]|uniref:DUF3592 domain-containing protein n=1 Tax=Kineococcus sp. SYSU DK002 TaxID=3383123 RepID=UPI003D7DBDA0
MEPQLPGLRGLGIDAVAGGGDGVPTAFVVVLVLTALLGVAVVVGGLRMALRARSRSREALRLRTDGVSTTGTVVDNRITSHREHRMTFSPVVRFAVDGRDVTVVGDQVWNRSFVTGRSAQVVYDPAAPDRAHVRAEGGSFLGRGFSGVVLAVFGLVFLAAVAVMGGFVASVF